MEPDDKFMELLRVAPSSLFISAFQICDDTLPLSFQKIAIK